MVSFSYKNSAILSNAFLFSLMSFFAFSYFRISWGADSDDKEIIYSIKKIIEIAKEMV